MANRQPASEDALNELHEVVARELKNRILSGEAGASDISNAIKFLKDNGVTAEPDSDRIRGAAGAVSDLPVFDEDEAEDRPTYN